MDEVKARLLPELVAEHAEMFMINGDMQSNLYTASRAMHSHILGLLQEGGGSAAAVRTSVGKLANLQVAVQRRWSNMMTDAIRQQVVEMFLGLKWEQHFAAVALAHPADLPLEVCCWVKAALWVKWQLRGGPAGCLGMCMESSHDCHAVVTERERA